MLYYDIFVFKTYTTSINLCGISVPLCSQVIHMKIVFQLEKLHYLLVKRTLYLRVFGKASDT